MRTHVSLPEDLVAEVDELAGPRGRSKFIEDAVRETVRRARLLALFAKVREEPPLDPGADPHWRTPEDVTRWVADGRKLDLERLEEKLRRFEG
jgi:hypothetical protein